MMAFMVTDNGLARFEDDPVVVSAMREAAHHNLYAIANSQAMNGIGPNTKIKAVEPGIIGTCRTAAIVFWVLFAVSLALWMVKRSKFMKTEEAAAYKEFKKSLKNK
jgi:beta-glucosidase